jgi:hypothetical protein
VLWAIVVFIIVAGVWLAGLTYLMWRAHQQRIKASEAKKPAEEVSSPEDVKPT